MIWTAFIIWTYIFPLINAKKRPCAPPLARTGVFGPNFSDEFNNEDFYNSDFEIKFRGMSEKLANGADVFQAIEEIIQREIDENEGF